MDERLCLSSESQCQSKNSDGCVSKVNFRIYNESIDKIGFICLVNDFLKEVHLNDHNELLLIQDHLVNHVEAKIAEWQYRQCMIEIAMFENRYVGFMVYESEHDVFGYIRAMYFNKDYKHKNLAWGFIRILAKKGIKKVLALSYEHNVEFKVSSRKKLICTKNGINFWDVNLGRKDELVK